MLELFKNWREATTFLMRLTAFAVTLVIIGAFFLSWMRIDGEFQARSGAELIALAMSPTVEYLFAVSPVQTGILLGCSVLMILASLLLMVGYGQRKTAPLPTAAILASVIAIIYATPDITADDEPGVGLAVIVVLSALLLVHQALIFLEGRLYYGRKLPAVYRVLSIITGGGYYRWNDGRAGVGWQAKP